MARTPAPELMLRWRTRASIAVLGYHRVGAPAPADYPFNEDLIDVTPEEFARELKFLGRHFNVLSMGDLIRGLNDPALLPPRPAVITFDDGYGDNEAVAFPILREAGMSACFFLCTGMIGTRRIPWQEAFVCCLKKSCVSTIPSLFGDDDPPYRLTAEHCRDSIRRFRQQMHRLSWSQLSIAMSRLKELTKVTPEEFMTEPLFMSWDAARKLAQAGMEIGAHTRSHPVLSRVEDVGILRDEVVGSRADVAAALGTPARAFAYPFGANEHMSTQADRIIQEAGFEISFSYIPGLLGRRVPAAADSRFRLPRLQMGHGSDYTAFRLSMATVPTYPKA